MLPNITLPGRRKRTECCQFKCMYKYCISDVLCQVYLFFVFLPCTEIVVTVLLPFFSSSPSCFLLNAKFLRGSCTCRSLRILPLIWCAFVSGLHCIHTDASPSPFQQTESHCDYEKCVLCRDETCSPENSRDNNSQRSGWPHWAPRCGHASLPESSLDLLHFAPPLPCSPGHLVSAKILSSNTINIIIIIKIKQRRRSHT